MTTFELSQLTLKTLENFFTSTDDEIQRSHLPFILTYKYYNIQDCTYRAFKDLVCIKILEFVYSNYCRL